MKRSYLEIAISASQSQRDSLIATMIELGSRGFQETETELLCYFDEEDALTGRQLRDRATQTIRSISSNARVRFRTIYEQNWNEQWEKTTRPIEIGEKITIKPSWAEYTNTENRIEIHIDPKMSFGTGYHETTRLILRLLERYVTHGCTILDVGTGTGILAIAAVKLGARRAIAIDNDPWSIENASENVAKNGLASTIVISDRPPDQFMEERFHLVTANISLQTIVEFLPILARLLDVNGILILSGLLKEDEKPLLQEMQRNRLHILDQLVENDWIAFVAERS